MASITAFSKDMSSTTKLSPNYDFIIVGGGTAGLVVASRLSENQNLRVLVIEAGPNKLDDPLITTPGLSGLLYDNPTYDWCFRTELQKELFGRQVPHPRGKVLGGSSAINQCKVVYTSKSSADSWESLGNTGWNWETLAPYYNKFHTNTAPSEEALKVLALGRFDEILDGGEGPVRTSFAKHAEPIDGAFYEAFRNIRSKSSNALFSDVAIGGFAVPSSINPMDNTRSHAGSAYFTAEVAGRTNLCIITDALVEKIIMQKGDLANATGVVFMSKAGDHITVNASVEVILAAGAVNSPQLLEISGIGSRSLLESHGIDVVIDNPNVGENLQDHPLSAVSFEAEDGVPTAEIMLRNSNVLAAVQSAYHNDRSGPLGNTFSASAYMPLAAISATVDDVRLVQPHSKTSTDDDNQPQWLKQQEVIRSLLSKPDGAAIHHFMWKGQLNVAGSRNIKDIVNPKTPGNFITLCASLNHPLSRGNVHIVSPDPFMKPVLDPKYLSNPEDLYHLARAIQFLTTLMSDQGFSRFFKPNGHRIPSEALLEDNLEAAEQVVRKTLMSNFHLSGTCAMGPRDIGGVVDERLIVHGTRNLRVVDASCFPLVPRGNIITTVYAVAERAVDLILQSLRDEDCSFYI